MTARSPIACRSSSRSRTTRSPGPPSGLNLADLVIEAPVEGDTTRFMAVFMCRPQVDAMVGPVRSVRYFNADLFQQLRGLTLHFGGAAKVIARLDANGVPRVNGLTTGWYFFQRAGVWGAPHNVFLDIDAVRAEMEEGGLQDVADDQACRTGAVQVRPRCPDARAGDASTASAWPRQASGTSVGTGAPRIAAGCGRTPEGRTSMPSPGDRMSARTVVVQVVRQDVLPGELDPGGFPRRYQYLVGEGVGVVYVGPRAYDVRWERAEADAVTKWTYADTGDPVVLPPGKVWWEIVPEGSAITEG